MKHLKTITENFIHHWNTKNDIIESVWGITEGEIFESFSDIEDEFEVQIKCDFYLQSKNETVFQLMPDNEEVMEAYAAAGFLPIIGLEISIQSGDIREVQSVMMDCLKNLNGYVLYKVSKNKQRLSLKLIQEPNLGEKEVSAKTFYHKKGNAHFTPLFTEFKKYGYKVIINKIFESSGKYFIKLPTGVPIYQHGHPSKNASKKLYSIDIEKSYTPIISMIDQLFEAKKCFESCLNDITNSDEFYDVSYDFEINPTITKSEEDIDKKVSVRFSITAYEL